MDSVVTELGREGFRIEKILAPSNKRKLAKYQIRRLPTFVYIRDGKEVRRISGRHSAQSVRNLWRESIF